MKKYIITEEDIERLYRIIPDLGEGLQVCTIVDNWIESLNYLGESRDYTVISPQISPKKEKTDENI